MSTILNAPSYDPRRARRRRNAVLAVIALIILGLFLWWHYRYYPEEHTVDKFLTDIEQKKYDQAFTLWTADPQWQQHTEKYKNYPFGQFQLDWGPSGDYGAISRHKIAGAYAAPGGANVIVAVCINDRVDPTALSVNRKTKEIGFSPVEVRVNTFTGSGCKD
jgi:hypothetical protein